MPKRRARAAPTGDSPPNRRQARRQKTEQRIIEAFGRIVDRDGLYQVRVNMLMREAGVGKKQLYQYFGDLSGVARAWTAAGNKAPGPGRATRAARPANSRMARLTKLLADYANDLQADPAQIAILHGELGGPREFAASLREVRQRILQPQVDFFLANGYMRQSEYTALYSVLYAAINYLALRSRFAPAFNGLDLARPAGWKSAMGMVETVAALAERSLERPAKPARKR